VSIGIQRMSKRHAIVRRLAAVETIGSITMICSDKTGTLTKGEMTCTELWTVNKTAKGIHYFYFYFYFIYYFIFIFLFLKIVTGAGISPEGQVIVFDKKNETLLNPESVQKEDNLSSFSALILVSAICNNSSISNEDLDDEKTKKEKKKKEKKSQDNNAWTAQGDATEVALTVASYKGFFIFYFYFIYFFILFLFFSWYDKEKLD
jgi:P-type Ca2+ transporter type 2C